MTTPKNKRKRVKPTDRTPPGESRNLRYALSVTLLYVTGTTLTMLYIVRETAKGGYTENVYV